MARKAQNQAKDTFNQAKGISATTGANANGIFPGLLQQYQVEATSPRGIGPEGITAENTASQQSIGGSTAGAVGQNNLMAARTRNKGGFQIANDESVRSGQRQNSTNAVDTLARDAQLKETQRQMGLAGENSLFGQNLQASLGALGAENGSTQALTQAGQSGWFQQMLGVINALSQGAQGAGAVMTGMGKMG
jgi:hypothetical protein